MDFADPCEPKADQCVTPEVRPMAKRLVASDTAVAPVDDDAPVVRSLSALRTAENECRRCPLYKNATQAVPGEGPNHAKVMLVGEQVGRASCRERVESGGVGGSCKKKLDEVCD